MLLAESGIYIITCTTTGKVYVGSSLNVYRRWHARHLPQLRTNKHKNRYLQAAWNKHSEIRFSCNMLETCAPVDLINREQFWIDTCDSANRKKGFNLNPVAGSSLGTTHTIATKLKIGNAKSKKYIVRSPEGQEQCITNLYQFCQQYNLTHNAMSKVAKGKARHHKGWECRSIDISRYDWLASIVAGPRRAQKVKNGQVWCSKCKEYKDTSDVGRDTQQPSGFAAYCRSCKAQKNLKRRVR